MPDKQKRIILEELNRRIYNAQCIDEVDELFALENFKEWFIDQYDIPNDFL